MRCLVIGGRGFIGSHLVDALLARGYRVRCFDRPNVLSLSNRLVDNENFELFEGDLASENDAADALADCEVCFHLACTTLPKSSNLDPVFDVESNVIGTIRLLTHAKNSGLRKIIFVSSGGTVYGVPNQLPISENHSTDPTCSYGISKLAIEKYLSLFRQLHQLDYIVLRLSNPFGERQRTVASQGAVAVFLGNVLRGAPVEIWGDGSVIRDYLHIDDVVSAFIISLESNIVQGVFNIGSGNGLSLNEVIDAIERVTGRVATRRYMPGRPFDIPVSVLCVEKARRELGWSAKVGFEEGLRRFAKWLECEKGVDLGT